jgi:hypothetical protein
MVLNWNEIKSRALLFSKTWADASNEDSQAKPFWIDFFEIFGITNKRVAFLFDLYQRITSLLPAPAAKKTRKTNTSES